MESFNFHYIFHKAELPEHPSSPAVFSGVHAARSLVLYVVGFFLLLFVLLSLIIWPLYCLSFGLPLLITSL